MLERIYVFDGFAGWDPEVGEARLQMAFEILNAVHVSLKYSHAPHTCLCL